ncbi:hypothetical protein J7E87_19995 [Streptomyces sp. ISL-1]|nr:hypothetical protein [Streptomyces sp. ISL-1]
MGRRLCVGTWLALEAWGRWLSGKTHADRSGLVRLGVVLRRLLASGFVAVFYGSIIQRAPGGIYLVPVVWAVGAWRMSDSSATPPPRGVGPSDGVFADEAAKSARGALDPNRIMHILHPAGEEVKEP